MKMELKILRTAFLRVAAILLFLTAALKAVSLSSEARILTQADPLFSFLTNRQLMAVAVGVELSVAFAVFSRRLDHLTKMAAVAWLATTFFAYRAGLWMIGYHGSCSCLGNAAAWLHVSPGIVDWAMRILLGFLLVGSYGLLAMEFKWPRRSAGARMQG
ncbi:MAG: hypothetical protein O2960_29295 [Verrucomicrobia bacterium]|nr:hypothetical protein [Verrucomicrobiota bacterium]